MRNRRTKFNGTVSGNVLNGKFSTTNPVDRMGLLSIDHHPRDAFDGWEYYSKPPPGAYTAKNVGPPRLR
jgi:hypothetical protein